MSESPSASPPEADEPHHAPVERCAPGRKPSKLPRHLPWLLFLGALLLRLAGIGWGLPNDLRNHSLHPDEPINYAYAQQIEPAKGDFEPGFYNYGSLYLTLLRVAGDVAAAYGESPAPSEPRSVWLAAGKGILAGRVVSAIAGAGTVLAIFLILRRFTRTLPAAMGALLVAVAPAHVVHSRFATVDVVATFFVALSTLYALRFFRTVEEPALSAPWRAAILAGLFAGLAAGTKYTGLLVILTLYVALTAKRQPNGLKLALAGTAAALVGFLASTPGALINWPAFSRDFSYELAHAASGHGLLFVERGSGYLVHLMNLAAGAGLLLLACGLVGFIASPRGLRGPAFAILAFAVPYFLLIGRSEVLFLRYTFPLYVALGFGFAMLIQQCADGLRGGTIITGIGILALGGIDGAGFQSAGQFTLAMAQPDPRDACARYLQKRLAQEPGASVGIVSDPWFYSPPLFPDANAPRPMFLQSFREILDEARSKGMIRFMPDDPASRFDWDRRVLTELRPAYVVFSSFESQDVDRLSSVRGLRADIKLQVDRFGEFMAELKKTYKADRFFGGGTTGVHDLDYVRPTLWVWKRQASP